MLILIFQVIGRWNGGWETKLQLNVSKIVWSAKDQANVIAAEAEKKRKQSIYLSSSFSAKSEYPHSNYNKDSSSTMVTTRMTGEDKIQLKNSELAEIDIGSFPKNIADRILPYQNSTVNGDNLLTHDDHDKLLSISRIPISVCALPCNIGVRKVMSTVRYALIICKMKYAFYMYS